jgi:ABC-type microcin C transport system permease subunit YejB
MARKIETCKDIYVCILNWFTLGGLSQISYGVTTNISRTYVIEFYILNLFTLGGLSQVSYGVTSKISRVYVNEFSILNLLTLDGLSSQVLSRFNCKYISCYNKMM